MKSDTCLQLATLIKIYKIQMCIACWHGWPCGQNMPKKKNNKTKQKHKFALLTCICSEILRRAEISHCTYSPHTDVVLDTCTESRQRAVVLAAVQRAVAVWQLEVVWYWAHVKWSSPADVQWVCAPHYHKLTRRSGHWNDNNINHSCDTHTVIEHHLQAIKWHSHILICML